VSDDLSTLDGYANFERTSLLGDPARLGHVKYLFVTALEGCVDAAQHVCASEGWGPPETNADAMAILARHGAIDDELGRAMASAVRFRNVLVHGYARVDNRLVVDHLGRLDDLAAYVAAVAALAR
jgi:uncharacterized protein YutE (UPF0331/DUF86 family)